MVPVCSLLRRARCMPQFGGRRPDRQTGRSRQVIDRARENARPVRPGQLGIRVDRKADGYRMLIQIPAAALTGFQPDEHPRLGFTYWLFDREHGEQTFSAASEFPFASDPSLWGTLELTK